MTPQHPFRCIFSLWIAGHYRAGRHYCSDGRDIFGRRSSRCGMGTMPGGKIKRDTERVGN